MKTDRFRFFKSENRTSGKRVGKLRSVNGAWAAPLLSAAGLLVVAFLTKLVGCSTVARWTGMSADESLAVGYGMVPRGEVGLIIAVIAQQAGVIGADLFSIIVLVIVLVSVLPAPLLRRALLRLPTASKPAPVPPGQRPA